VPQRSASLAHVISADSAGDLRRYMAALDDASLPPADFQWQRPRGATIRTAVNPGQKGSGETCYQPGWHAAANGRPARARKDGLGFLLIEPECNGPCRIDLSYKGGPEYITCRVLSFVALLGLAGYAWRSVR